MTEKETTSEEVYRFAKRAIKQNPLFIEDMQRAFIVGVREREAELHAQMQKLDVAAMLALSAVNGNRLSGDFRTFIETSLAEYYSERSDSHTQAVDRFLKTAAEKENVND